MNPTEPARIADDRSIAVPPGHIIRTDYVHVDRSSLRAATVWQWVTRIDPASAAYSLAIVSRSRAYEVIGKLNVPTAYSLNFHDGTMKVSVNIACPRDRVIHV